MNAFKYAVANNFLPTSAIRNFRTTDSFFCSLNINIAVEIGTSWGMGAAYIAQFANEVHTFDILDRDINKRTKIWNDLKVKDKISFHLIKNRDEVKEILAGIDFDFAFVDGYHTYNDVKEDFELVKGCRRVLFHDIDEKQFPQIYKFINELGGVKTITFNIGYWETK